MSYQHTYAKLYAADDGATSGRLQMPFDVLSSQATEDTQDDSSSKSLVPVGKVSKKQSLNRYGSWMFAFTFAISLTVLLGFLPQDASASPADLATAVTDAITAITAYVPSAVKGVAGLGAVSFVIIFVVGIIKIARAVL